MHAGNASVVEYELRVTSATDIICIYVNTHREMNPKRFTMATMALASASEKTQNE